MKRKPDELRRQAVLEEQARLFRERYRPIVKQHLEINAAGSSLDLEALLLSVYLQGVMDGANPAVQGLRKGRAAGGEVGGPGRKDPSSGLDGGGRGRVRPHYRHERAAGRPGAYRNDDAGDRPGAGRVGR